MIGDFDFELDCPQRYWLGVIAEAWQVPRAPRRRHRADGLSGPWSHSGNPPSLALCRLAGAFRENWLAQAWYNRGFDGCRNGFDFVRRLAADGECASNSSGELRTVCLSRPQTPRSARRLCICTGSGYRRSDAVCGSYRLRFRAAYNRRCNGLEAFAPLGRDKRKRQHGS